MKRVFLFLPARTMVLLSMGFALIFCINKLMSQYWCLLIGLQVWLPLLHLLLVILLPCSLDSLVLLFQLMKLVAVVLPLCLYHILLQLMLVLIPIQLLAILRLIILQLLHVQIPIQLLAVLRLWRRWLLLFSMRILCKPGPKVAFSNLVFFQLNCMILNLSQLLRPFLPRSGLLLPNWNMML
ncbi:hypothetical protein V6Z11_A13G138200 [Gossypium hirsutum]